MRLFIYHLGRLEKAGWDEAVGFIVRARSSTRARQIVAETPSFETGPGCEGANVWRDPRQSSCRKLGEVTSGANRRECIVLRDFKAG